MEKKQVQLVSWFLRKHLDKNGLEEINNGKRTGPTGSLVPS